MPERKQGKFDQGPNELLFGHTPGLLSQEIREILVGPNLIGIDVVLLSQCFEIVDRQALDKCQYEHLEIRAFESGRGLFHYGIQELAVMLMGFIA